MQTTEHCVRRGSHLWRTYIPISVSAGRGRWAVAVSLCLSPCPRVQHRLQTQDCNHCKILPHRDAKWTAYKTSNDSYSLWVLSPIVTQMGTSSLDLGNNLGNSSHQTLHGEIISFQAPVWVFMELHQRLTSHQPWHSCLRREFIPPLRASAPHKQMSAGYSHCADPNKNSHLYSQIIKENRQALCKTVICLGWKQRQEHQIGNIGSTKA